MIITIAIVSAAVTLLVEVAKVVVKKTKNTTDDKVVDFIAKHEDQVIGFIKDRLPKAEAPKPEPRPRDRDHRGDN